ncbi:hypothetical protein SLH46_11760 [Draconibacterium sp. IB214405]|uniref:hypothetical protein n=1 Tax=Draconibacterium sp. IB214405 TaxID=3097352 RepID=UPI002A114C0F|nr:hypothetical protein [Draconibacterium sp. IB214405]MDX8339864.1 hypothetical protein [Draconibacterium sp. IB214405]
MKHLSQIEIDKIKEEEILRNEIRQNLSSKTKNNRLSFLNKPFFIWFMSSCVLTFITFLYNKSQENLEKEKILIEQEYQKKQRVNKLDNEIYLRLDNTFNWTIEWIMYEKENKIKGDSASKMPFNPCKRVIDAPEKNNYYYPEFKDRNLISLILELKEIEDNKNDIKKLDKAIGNLKNLKSEFYYKKEYSINDFNGFSSNLDSIYALRWDPMTKLNESLKNIGDNLDSVRQIIDDIK